MRRFNLLTMSTTTASDLQTLPLLRTLVSALEDEKADGLTVLYVGGISDITDYLVLATGNSEPHLRALRIEVEKVFDAAKVPIAGMEQGDYGSGWTIVDAYQIMVHVFTAEQRSNYALEKLWKDARPVDLKTFEAEPAKPAKAIKATTAKRSVVKKTATKKSAAKSVTKKSTTKKSDSNGTVRTNTTVSTNPKTASSTVKAPAKKAVTKSAGKTAKKA